MKRKIIDTLECTLAEHDCGRRKSVEYPSTVVLSFAIHVMMNWNGWKEGQVTRQACVL